MDGELLMAPKPIIGLNVASIGNWAETTNRLEKEGYCVIPIVNGDEHIAIFPPEEIIYVVKNINDDMITEIFSRIPIFIGDTIGFGERAFKVKYRKLHYGPVNQRIQFITLTVIEL